MLLYLITSSFDGSEDTQEDQAIRAEFDDKQGKFVDALQKQLSGDHYQMSLCSVTNLGTIIPLSENLPFSKINLSDVLHEVNGEHSVTYILEVDLIDHHKNISLVWDLIQDATSVGISVSAFGPTDFVNGEARLAQQEYCDGEIDEGWSFNDDPESEEWIVDIDDLEEYVKLAYYKVLNGESPNSINRV